MWDLKVLSLDVLLPLFATLKFLVLIYFHLACKDFILIQHPRKIRNEPWRTKVHVAGHGHHVWTIGINYLWLCLWNSLCDLSKVNRLVKLYCMLTKSLHYTHFQVQLFALILHLSCDRERGKHQVLGSLLALYCVYTGGAARHSTAQCGAARFNMVM